MEKEKYTIYFENKAKIKKLEEENKLINPEIMADMAEKDVTSIGHELGNITLAERTTYKYSEEVDKKTIELKALKKLEEANETATPSITKYITAKLQKAGL